MRRLSIALLAVVTSCSINQSGSAAADHRQIERLIDAISDSVAEAVGRRDVPRLGQLLGEAQYIGSGLLIPPGQFVAVAGPAFDHLATIHLTWRSRDVRVLTPRVALMTARATTVSRDASGKTAQEEGLYTMVFVRAATGEWQLVSIHKTIESGGA